MFFAIIISILCVANAEVCLPQVCKTRTESKEIYTNITSGQESYLSVYDAYTKWLDEYRGDKGVDQLSQNGGSLLLSAGLLSKLASNDLYSPLGSMQDSTEISKTIFNMLKDSNTGTPETTSISKSKWTSGRVQYELISIYAINAANSEAGQAFDLFLRNTDNLFRNNITDTNLAFSTSLILGTNGNDNSVRLLYRPVSKSCSGIKPTYGINVPLGVLPQTNFTKIKETFSFSQNVRQSRGSTTNVKIEIYGRNVTSVKNCVNMSPVSAHIAYASVNLAGIFPFDNESNVNGPCIATETPYIRNCTGEVVLQTTPTSISMENLGSTSTLIFPGGTGGVLGLTLNVFLLNGLRSGDKDATMCYRKLVQKITETSNYTANILSLNRLEDVEGCKQYESSYSDPTDYPFQPLVADNQREIVFLGSEARLQNASVLQDFNGYSRCNALRDEQGCRTNIEDRLCEDTCGIPLSDSQFLRERFFINNTEPSQAVAEQLLYTMVRLHNEAGRSVELNQARRDLIEQEEIPSIFDAVIASIAAIGAIIAFDNSRLKSAFMKINWIDNRPKIKKALLVIVYFVTVSFALLPLYILVYQAYKIDGNTVYARGSNYRAQIGNTSDWTSLTTQMYVAKLQYKVPNLWVYPVSFIVAALICASTFVLHSH